MNNMIRDAERYALISFEDRVDRITFVLHNMKVNKDRKVYIKK